MMDLKTLNFTQSSPSATWTINHSFASKPEIDVMIEYDGALQKVYPMSIVHTSDTTATVHFSSAVKGIARLVGLISDIRRSQTLSFEEHDNV